MRALSRAISRASPAFEFGLDLCVFLFLPILVLASKGVAPLIAVAGLCALGIDAANLRAAWYRVRGLALLFALLVLWGLASSLWAIQPARSLLIALRLAGLFAAGAGLIAASSEIAAPRRMLACLVTGFIVALGLAAIQASSGGALTASWERREFLAPALNHAEDGFSFLLLPVSAILILQRRCVLAAFLAAIGFAAISQLVGDAARMAFIAGAAVSFAVYRWRTWLLRAAAIMSVALILAAPLIFPTLASIGVARHEALTIKFSAFHRLEIWSFVGARIAKKPLLGWGLDSSRVIPGGSAEIKDGIAVPHQWLPLHPHNSALQIWLELGVPGALLLAALVTWLWLALGRAAWPSLYTAATGGGLVTALGVAFGSYGIWQEWLISAEFLTLFLIRVMARLASQPMPETRSGAIS